MLQRTPTLIASCILFKISTLEKGYSYKNVTARGTDILVNRVLHLITVLATRAIRICMVLLLSQEDNIQVVFSL